MKYAIIAVFIAAVVAVGSASAASHKPKPIPQVTNYKCYEVSIADPVMGPITSVIEPSIVAATREAQSLLTTYPKPDTTVAITRIASC